ncbi:MAG TPA: hypothetical protein DIT01_13655 [Lentisphaeria bacterium]|nr:hypothetical protein [Lentisphaeria bacterium]
MNLTTPMAMAAANLQSWLDPAHGYRLTGGFGIAHDTGRLWDALLRYEQVSDFVMPAEAEAAMLQNLHAMFDNPDGLLFVPPGLHWTPPRFELHSLREGLLTLTARIRNRHDDWAADAARRMLQTVKRIVKDDGTIDPRRLDYFQYMGEDRPLHRTHTTLDGSDYTAVTGRFIEALVWHYELTGEALALELAQLFFDYHLEHTVNADGSPRAEIFSPDNQGHTHSYLGTLRGLLRHGLLTGRRDCVDTVYETYRDAVSNHLIKPSGWVAHDLGTTLFHDNHGNPLAECTSACDVVQLALWLALEDGRVELLDDVERYLRARVLPAQIQESDAIDNPGMAVPAQHIGGWGCCEYPYSTKKPCMPDYPGAILHSLTDVYANICTRSATGLHVNLHADYVGEGVTIHSERDETGRLTITLDTADNLFIRIPGWAPPASVRITVDGDDTPVERVGPVAQISGDTLSPPGTVMMTYALPERRSSETTPVGDVYELLWRGDEIAGINPNEGPRLFYPDLA